MVAGSPLKAVIVTAEEPSPTANEAAKVLQLYIQKISGAKLEILTEKNSDSKTKIFVGRSNAVKRLGVDVPSGYTKWMNEEGFVIRTVGNNLVIAGNEDWNYRGTVFAVNAFLESLGCRWFFPGEYGKVVPSLKTITVGDINREERPSFRIRMISFGPDKEWRDRCK